MGNIKVADYLINLTKYDDIERDSDNRIVLDKYIDRVHADKISCHKIHYHGTKEPMRPYSIFRIKSPESIYLARERRNSSTTALEENLNRVTKVNNDAIWGKIYNDCGVNAVEGSVAYKNTSNGKLFYSITQHLRTLTNCNREKLVFESPNFFLHLSDMLENKEEYLKTMTEECFDDIVSALIASVISGETDMHGASTYLLKYIYDSKYTDICRIGLEEHAYDDAVDQGLSYEDIKNGFDNTKEIYCNSMRSASTRILLTPRQQIESLKLCADNGLFSPQNLTVIENMANYDIDECLRERRENAGAILTQSHADAIKYYLSQAENIL